MENPNPFSFTCPTQVYFGAGEHRRIASLLPEDAQRVVLVRGQSGRASASVLERLNAAGFNVTEVGCDQEPTVLSINRALDMLGDIQADVVVACGGGTAIDTAKVICFALSHKLCRYEEFVTLPAALLTSPSTIPCIALPTTAGTGAEVTANAVIGVPAQAAKVSLRGRALFPTLAIIDPELMREAPAHVVLHAGLDAVTQVFESFTSNAATPFSDALTRSVKAKGLPALRGVLESNDPTAWADLAWISHVSGLALANSGLGAAHGLASVIGGRFDAPHGALCGRLLIPVLRQNLSCAAEGSEAHMRLLSCCADVLDVFPPTRDGDALSGFAAWVQAKGVPRLSNWLIGPDDLASLATAGMAASSSQKNAVTLGEADYLQILHAAL